MFWGEFHNTYIINTILHSQVKNSSCGILKFKFISFFHFTIPHKIVQIGGLKFKGRFSVIRDAVDSTTEGHAHCAVKIRHPSSEAISEYESLRDGQHENVQRLIAAFNNSNFLYLLSERLYEDVFSRFVFNDYYTEEQVALTMRQVTSALHFLHFKG